MRSLEKNFNLDIHHSQFCGYQIVNTVVRRSSMQLEKILISFPWIHHDECLRSEKTKWIIIYAPNSNKTQSFSTHSSLKLLEWKTSECSSKILTLFELQQSVFYILQSLSSSILCNVPFLPWVVVIIQHLAYVLQCKKFHEKRSCIFSCFFDQVSTVLFQVVYSWGLYCYSLTVSSNTFLAHIF